MVHVLFAPGAYVQGVGAIRDIGRQVSPLGARALVIGSRTGMARTRDTILPSLKVSGVAFSVELFSGECSRPEIDRLKEVARQDCCDIVIGIGGGKVLDTSKVVAWETEARLVTVPTIASTDAPCSRVSVVYDDQHVVMEDIAGRNADLVLVDTEVCVQAPVRFLVSGMGDALATWFEADACRRSGRRKQGLATMAALALARLCYETLIEFGPQAKEAASRGVVTPAVEKVVEANTLLSGIGFESGGLAVAHSIYNGFTVLGQKHGMYHGEVVAFGTLVQLVMEGRTTRELNEVLDFSASVGLPYTLAQMNLGEVSEEELYLVAERACAEGEFIHNMSFPVAPKLALDSIKGADAVGRAYAAKHS